LKAKSNILKTGQTSEQLILHPFCSLWAIEDISYHIRTRWKIGFKYRLTRTLHVGEDGLPEMPAEEFVSGSIRMIEELRLKMSARNVICVSIKENNLVIVLK